MLRKKKGQMGLDYFTINCYELINADTQIFQTKKVTNKAANLHCKSRNKVVA